MDKGQSTGDSHHGQKVIHSVRVAIHRIIAEVRMSTKVTMEVSLEETMHQPATILLSHHSHQMGALVHAEAVALVAVEVPEALAAVVVSEVAAVALAIVKFYPKDTILNLRKYDYE